MIYIYFLYNFAMLLERGTFAIWELHPSMWHAKNAYWIFLRINSNRLFFGSAAAVGISGSVKTKKYLDSPVAGDIYEIKRKENGNSLYTLYRIANVTTDSITFDVNNYEAEGTKGLRKLREQSGDSYSEKVTLARTELIKMEADNRISTIERKRK